MPRIAREQQQLLSRELKRKTGRDYQVFVGMRHWHPLIEDAVEAIARSGEKDALCISLSPLYASVSTGAFFATAREAALRHPGLNLHFSPSWHNHPQFIEALAESLKTGLSRAASDARDVPVVFTAHSLPVDHIQNGDPYAEQMKDMVERLVTQVELNNIWYLAYQSKGAGSGEWLGPLVEDLVIELGQKGHKTVIIQPVGFAIDHMETLYDLDIELKQTAADAGVEIIRCSCPNTSPRFMDMLGSLVLDHFERGASGNRP